MKCDDISPKITAYLLGDLGDSEAAEVRKHLETCDACRALARETEPTLELLRGALAGSSQAPQRLSASHRRRISRSVLGEESGRRILHWIGLGHPRLAAAASIVAVCGFLWLAINSMRSTVPRERTGAAARRAAESSLTTDMERGGPPPYASDGTADIRATNAVFADSLALTGESAPTLDGKDISGAGDLTYGWFAGGVGGAVDETISGAYRIAQQGGMTDFASEREEETRRSGDRDGDAYANMEGLKLDLPSPAYVGTPKSIRRPNLETPPPPPSAPARAPSSGPAPVTPPAPVEEAERPEREVTLLGEVKKPGPQVFDDDEPATLGRLLDRTGGLTPYAREKSVGIIRQDEDGTETVITADTGKILREGELDADVELHDGDRVIVPARRFSFLGGSSVKPDRKPGRPPEDTAAAATKPVARGVASGTEAPAASEPEPEPSNELYGQDLAPVSTRVLPGGQRRRREIEHAAGEDLRRGEDPAAAGGAFEVNGFEAGKREREDRWGEAKDLEDEPTAPRFRAFGVNPFVDAAENAVSTFSIDVDTAAYTLSRNYMQRGLLPPPDAVRTEEFVNFFDYGDKAPAKQTFRVYAEAAPSPFGRGLHLLRIGVKGKRLGREEQRRAVLTFVVDTSGSMEQPDRIGLLKAALKLLVSTLNPDDEVAIVQYGSQARLVLEHTPASEAAKIVAALDRLQCGGSTNLGAGMKRAYELAARRFEAGAENRVLLLSDGVANLGTDRAEDILASIEAYRRRGITCSVFGFGMGTYDDTMLETLANQGDGAYAFIDSLGEARRVFVDDLSATLNTIATDVKIQVEFNPRLVRRYRQLGYENRQLREQDFRDDAVDAGEVGSGQSVTALYELDLTGVRGSPAARRRLDLATVRVRYRRIDNGRVEEIEHAVRLGDVAPAFDKAPAPFRLAAAVAEFAEILRGSPHAAGSRFADVADVLRPVALDLEHDARVQELLRLVIAAPGMSRAPGE